MITLTRLANEFESGLNEAFDNPEIQFKIWAEAGDYQPFRREGNIVTFFINGNLRTDTAANEANNLVMGINGLALDFAVPIRQPRTNSRQNSEELAKIKNGQFPFVEKVVNVINKYFEKAQAKIMHDKDGKQFSVAFRAGSAVSGSVDLVPELGNIMEISTYIEVYFIEGGLSSKDLIVYFDNSIIPFTAVRHGRSPVTEGEVYAGTLISKNVVTSTAFAVDVDYPLNADELTKSCIDYLLSGEPNVGHFVNVVFGDIGQKLFFMTLNIFQTSATGINVAGGSVSLMEVTANHMLVNTPAGYQTGRFILDGSTVAEIAFTPSEGCNALIAGKAGYISGLQSVAITPADIVYDEETDKYCVYLVTDRAVTVNSSTQFEIVKEADNG